MQITYFENCFWSTRKLCNSIMKQELFTKEYKERLYLTRSEILLTIYSFKKNI